jgi:FkbM family methyltransferase
MNVISEYKYGKIIYNINDYYIGTTISEYGEYCDEEIELITQLVNKGDTVLDIGANIGLMTIPFSKMVGKNGEVIAYEPQPEIYKILCGNIAINNLYNVKLENVAVGNDRESVYIPNIDYRKPNNFGGIELLNSGDIEIKQIRLDDMSFNKINFIKIDVETMELNVLNGAYYTIKKHRPLLYVENDRLENSKEILKFLLNEGYDCYWHVSNLFKPNNYKHNTINVFDKNYICVNVLAIPNEKNITMNLKKINSIDDWFNN